MAHFSFTKTNWLVGFGKIPTKNAVWHDQDLFATFGSPSSMAFSASKRFVIVGKRTKGFSLNDIVQMWEKHGRECLRNIYSFFAFVIWDCEKHQLHLCRDGVGGKTLYYTTDHLSWWIAPCLQSLRPYHQAEINPIALRDYLCCAFVPGERTMWKGVKELSSGNILTLPQEETNVFWRIEDKSKSEIEDMGYYADRLRHLLVQVVRENLPEHGKVGVFLSGGLDSSAVAALSAKIHQQEVIAYSIHFGKDLPNELEFSGLVAQHCGLEHQLLEISFKDMWKFLPEAMALLDDPIGDPLTVPNLLLAKLAKQSVSIILNGEGGDPCFGGPKNQPMLLNQVYGGNLNTSYLRSFQKCADDLPQLLKPEIWELVKDQPFFFESDLNSDMDFLQKLFMINIKFKGADHILTKVNNLLGAVEIEGRSPLFDPRIVDLSLSMHINCKVSGAIEKSVLKQAMIDFLPTAIIHRPKSGMMVPVQLGFQKYWNKQAKDLLLSKNAAIAPYLQTETIRSWLNYQGDPWKRYGVKLWLLVSLELWIQQHR